MINVLMSWPKPNSFAYSRILMKMLNIEENKGQYVAIAGFWMGHKICLASLGSILMTASVIRGTTLMP